MTGDRPCADTLIATPFEDLASRKMILKIDISYQFVYISQLSGASAWSRMIFFPYLPRDDDL